MNVCAKYSAKAPSFIALPRHCAAYVSDIKYLVRSHVETITNLFFVCSFVSHNGTKCVQSLKTLSHLVQDSKRNITFNAQADTFRSRGPDLI